MLRKLFNSNQSKDINYQKADIYSFGITLQEIVVRGAPYDGSNLTSEGILCSLKTCFEMILYCAYIIKLCNFLSVQKNQARKMLVLLIFCLYNSNYTSNLAATNPVKIILCFQNIFLLYLVL